MPSSGSLTATARATAAAWSVVATLVIIFGAYTRHVTVFVLGGFGLVMAIRALRGQVTWTRAVVTSVSIGVPVFGAVLAAGAVGPRPGAGGRG